MDTNYDATVRTEALVFEHFEAFCAARDLALSNGSWAMCLATWASTK